ncbi:MAG: 3-phosphoshikimate 1-carboxyvinyltransferase [Synergistetes bacterium]|nr:3-phosphoshikimate 1-carboxyvinyltransferase [Synergistota bacterium]
MEINGVSRIKGVVRVPPDKSISHRALLLSSVASAPSEVQNLLESDDVKRSLNLLKACGTKFEGSFRKLIIKPQPFNEPIKPIFCGNSGTTARISLGLLASQNGFFTLYGDKSLSRRPMLRVVKPLKEMGARISGRDNDSLLPISIRGGSLRGITYSSSVASAQVKGAILLASLFASGKTIYSEPYKSRDHTERMLKTMGALIAERNNEIEIKPSEKLTPLRISVPGDISSAAFFITLGAIHKNADLTIVNVGLNPTRTGLLRVLKRMGANIEVSVETQDPEPQGKIRVSSSHLRGTIILPEEIPQMIDELPLVALLGIFAEGKTIVRGARELRYKESDRISSTVRELRKMGADIVELEDGFIVQGRGRLNPAKVNAHGDHRIAMLLSIASLCLREEESTSIRGEQWIKISFPNFFKIIKEITSN